MSETKELPTDQIWQHRLLRLDYLPAGELVRRFNLLNPRSHPESQKDATESSLEKVQWIDEVSLSTNGDGPPSLADNPDAVLFDGHERVEIVLARFGPDALVPVKWYRLNKEETDFALLVKDQTTGMAEYIPERLAALMERTRAMVADKPGLAGMLDRLKEQAGVNGKGQVPPELPPPIDKAAELQEIWQVKPGDIWQAGPHFVICGDCREAETWQRLLSAAGIEKINGCFTSPPYAEQRKAQYGGVPTTEYVEWWEAVQGNVRENLAGDGSFFVNIKPHCEDGQRVLYVFDLVLAMVRTWGWRFVDELCWRNTKNGVPGTWPNRLKNAFEPIYQFSLEEGIKFKPEQGGQITNGAFNYHPLNQSSTTNTPFTGAYKHLGYHQGVSLPSNVIETSAEGAGLHQAPFPVDLPAFTIKAYSDPGDVWLDPFCGSGTTLVAANAEERIGLGIEALPKYCSVICERLKALGLTPTLTDQGAR